MTSVFTGENTFPLPLVAEDSAPTQPVASLSPYDLTRRMREGCDNAWMEFHRQYYLLLLRYAVSRTRAPDDAAEIVQQAYLRIARHIKSFKEEQDFWRWLMCVVRCVALDHQRGVARRATLLEKFAHWQNHHQDSREMRADGLAHEALARFSEEDAQLLRLKYLEGWSTQQLATNAATTPKAIESRLGRLRQRLRDIITKTQ